MEKILITAPSGPIGSNIDQSKHPLFSASKLAADIMVQEYGRYFCLKTCCLQGVR